MDYRKTVADKIKKALNDKFERTAETDLIEMLIDEYANAVDVLFNSDDVQFAENEAKRIKDKITAIGTEEAKYAAKLMNWHY